MADLFSVINAQRACRRFDREAKVSDADLEQMLDEAADRMARQLLGIAETAESEAVKLAAVRDVLDRVIDRAPTTLHVSVGPRPWETVFDDIASGSRSESRARRGAPEGDAAPEWVAPELAAAQAIDVEVIDVQAEPDPASRRTPAGLVPAPITGLDAITEAARVNGRSAR